jgi:hypothetical protein
VQLSAVFQHVLATIPGEPTIDMKNAVFSGVTPCDSCKNRRFGRTYRFHNHSDKNRRALVASYGERFSYLADSLNSDDGGDVLPKRRFLQEPNGVTFQKTAFFIVTAMKSSNLT